jgi:hypothetical protein
MRSRTSSTCYAAGSIVVLMCAALAPCEVSQAFERIDTGQTRELINRPSCGVLEVHIDGDYCEFARRQ